MKIRASKWPDGMPAGEAILTTGGSLLAKNVVHTVGPVWHGGTRGEADLLWKAYQNSISVAQAADLKSISFPSISTGAYGYPIAQAGKIALRATKEFLKNKEPPPRHFEQIRFILFFEKDYELYLSLAKEVFQP